MENKEKKDKKIIRRSKLAEIFGVSETTIWRWQRDGVIPQPIRLGPRMIGWLSSDISEFLEQINGKGEL